jgi:hypothetical protein
VSPYASADTRERVRAVQRMTNAERAAAGMRPKGPAAVNPADAPAAREARIKAKHERIQRELRGENCPPAATKTDYYRRLNNAERAARGMQPVGRRAQRVESMPLSAAVVKRAEVVRGFVSTVPFVRVTIAVGELPKAAPAVSFALTAQAQFREDVYGMLNKWAALFEADKRALLNVNGGRGA